MGTEPIQAGNDRDELLAALMELRRDLCQRSFDPGLQRVIAARDLLLEMAATGGPVNPAEWESWLAPLFCANEKQQEQFHELFRRWLARHRQIFADRTSMQSVEMADDRPGNPGGSIGRDPRREDSPFQAVRRLWTLRRTRRLLAGGAILLLFALGGLFWLGQSRQIRLSGTVRDGQSGMPLAGAVVRITGQSERRTGPDGQYRAEFQVSPRRLLNGPAEIEIVAVHPDYFDMQVGHTIQLLQKEAGSVGIDLALQPRGKAPLDARPVRPVPTPGRTPSPTPSPTTSGPSPPINLTLRDLLLIVAPLLLWLAWQLLTLLLRTWWLQRVSSGIPPDLRTLPIEDPALELFASPKEQRLMVELRRPRPLDLHDLNLRATVRETARSGGVFTPSYQRLRSSPEYLLLIDQQNIHDEQARVGIGLLKSLDRNGVYVEAFSFQDDPSHCQSLKQNAVDAPAVTLRYLAGRYPDHRLLIISDAASFYDSSSGQPQPWLEQLEPWSQRSLLTPKPPDKWGFREEDLRQRLFSLLPLSAEGLRLLGDLYNHDQFPQPEIGSTAPFPASIANRPERWVDRDEPDQPAVERMLAEVERYLGPDGYVWLCAVAIYPEMIWELTICHGYWLLAERNEGTDLRTALILRLVRLPWFRQGYMPDWLRVRLINQLSRPERRDKRDLIRDNLEKLLLTAASRPDKIVALEIAVPKSQTLRERAVGFLRRWGMKLQIQRQGEQELLRDYVFLSFMTGRRVKPAGVRLPDLLKRIFFRDGNPWLGLRPVVTFLAALVISGGLALTWWTRTRPQDRTEQPPSSETPRSELTTPPPTPLPGEVATPTPQPRPVTERGAIPPATPRPPSPGEVLSPTPQPGSASSPERTSTGYIFTLGEGVTLEVNSLPRGTFMMGSDEFEFAKPVHQVRVEPFNIGRTEVTQAQWRAVMGNNPSDFKGDTRPVENVSWIEAKEFCRRLSEMTSFNFRLPTEAEWEYAARAGTRTRWSFGDDEEKLGEYAWFFGNARGETHPVGAKKPNGYGLYDMHGNVWEWVEDHWHSDYKGAPTDGRAWLTGDDNASRVLRGGSWNDDNVLRSANRYLSYPDFRNLNFGFRVVVGEQTQRGR